MTALVGKLYGGAAYLLIIELVFIPSAQLTALKMGTILLLMFLLTVDLVNKQMRVSKFILFLFLFVTSFLLSSLLLGFFQGSIDAYVSGRTFASYFVVFTTVILLYLSVKNNLLSRAKVLRTFIYSMSIFVVVKTILMMAPLFGWISPREFMELMSGSMLVAFRSEDALFVRLATGNDLLLSFALFFLLFQQSFGFRVSSKLKVPILFILLLGVTLTFTRYIWASAIIVLIFYAIEKKIILRLLSGLIGVLLVLTVVDGYLDLGIVKEVGVRFGDSASLDKKSEQASVLINGIDNYVLFGKGLGSYIESYIRSAYMPSQYETQWLSLALQFGMPGVFFILLVMLVPLVSMIRLDLRAKRESLYLGMLYILFLLSAFTNPNLFILNVVMVYFLVAIMIPNKATTRMEVYK